MWRQNDTIGCQDLIHPMYSASLSIVLTCLLFTPLGPDHPWCASGNALSYYPLGGTRFSVISRPIATID